jgi:type I restriction enzyme R subunit
LPAKAIRRLHPEAQPVKLGDGYSTALYTDPQQAFLDFVLEQYVKEGVGELDQSKLPQLLDLRHQSTADAETALGPIASIREVFIGFQPGLYARQ